MSVARVEKQARTYAAGLVLTAAIFISFSSAWGQTAEPALVFVGDSVTEGYGVKKEEAYPELTQRLLAEHGHKVRVVNGGIGGSVTADADRRVRWYLRQKPALIVLALGGNDGLKGTPTKVIKANLARAIDQAKDGHAKVLLCGMRLFTNLGQDYVKDFEKLYRDLASEKHVEFFAFPLEEVLMKAAFVQADGKHPNAKGHAEIARRLTPVLEKLL